MEQEIYGFAGSFAMKPGGKKGVHVFRYEPETGRFLHLSDGRPEINAGQGLWDRGKGVLYVTHESRDREGELGGGGRILAGRLDRKTGAMSWEWEADTLAALPSYLCIEASGRYLLVPHHATGNVTTRTVRGEDGVYRAETECDDGTIAVFERKDDGGIGRLRSVFHQEPVRREGRLLKIPHLHSILQSPDGRLLLACDKGLDCIHGYRLDRETGELSKISETFVEEGAHPRYGLFHQSAPVFYQNCENSAYLHVWHYDSGSGELRRLQRIPLLKEEKAAAAWTEEGAADLVLSEDGRNLYGSVRGLNVISVFGVLEDGTLELKQNIDCQGKNPRGLALAPDGRFLFSLNRDSGHIARFRVLEDGTLEAAGADTECSLAAWLRFGRA